LRRSRYDLIHAHFGLSGWVARCQFRLPIVVSFMGDDVLGRFARSGRVTLYGRLLRASGFVLARSVSAVILKSNAMKSKLRIASAHVIPNGVDLSLFRPASTEEARAMLVLDPRKKFVLFPYDAGIATKRFDLVQEAVLRARAQISVLEILRVSRVPQNQMPIYMNAADMLVLASESEGSPNVIKEAMATNLPVITVDVGDAAELVGQTEGCYVVPRQADAIAEKIIEVCRRGRRTRGRDSIERLSMEVVAKQITDVYADVLRRSGGKP
jgi:teichuronic acid biosynthesis glycosyltransferase TuaC